MLFTQSTAYLIRRDVNLQWQMCILRKKMTLFWMVLCAKRRINLCCVHHLQITKKSSASCCRAGRSHRPVCPVSCSALTPTDLPPSRLFIVESVLICFIMKNKFAKVYWYAFLYRHIKIQLVVGAECVAWLYTWLACVYFDFVTCNLLFTMRGFL